MNDDNINYGFAENYELQVLLAIRDAHRLVIAPNEVLVLSMFITNSNKYNLMLGVSCPK
jgi:hypothetical protein